MDLSPSGNPSPARAIFLCFYLGACGAPGGGCALSPLPQGAFPGETFDSAGALRLSPQGLAFLNANAHIFLKDLTPGTQLNISVPCNIEQAGANLIKLAIADTGEPGCTEESCGRLDGVCDERDSPHSVVITISSLELLAQSPDVLEARFSATAKTGLLPISTVGKNSLLCLFTGRAKCTLDLDTGRRAPAETVMRLGIRLAIDTRWDKLLSLQVAEVGGTKACGSSGALPQPNCLDPDDVIIANEGGCGACSGADNTLFKSLLIDQLAKSLTAKLRASLDSVNSAPCDESGQCPTSPSAVARCEWRAPDSGICIDTGTQRAVPQRLGVEGRLAPSSPQGAGLFVALKVGGAVEASSAGITLGLRGGAQAELVSSCAAAATPPPAPLPALPDFDARAPAPHAVALSLSQRFLSQLAFGLQQSGSLCTEAGADTNAALNSGLLAAFFPSLSPLAHGENVPLRVLLRPVVAPSIRIGEGTVDGQGRPLNPLLRVIWPGLELDVYALLEERLVRLFTLAVDVDLPVALASDGCRAIAPVLGPLADAIKLVSVKNSELLAETQDDFKGLLPVLLPFLEPQLEKRLKRFTLPEVQGYRLKVVAMRGVGEPLPDSGYGHLALYADLEAADAGCVPVP